MIPEGKVTVETAYKLMPFENNLVVVTLTGEKVKELITYFIKGKKAHPLSQHVELTINGENYNLTINNQPFDPHKTYTVLTSDYLQNGGDSMYFFKNPENQYRQYRTEHQGGNLCGIHFFFKISRASNSNSMVSINSNPSGILGEGKPAPHSIELLLKR